MTLARSAVLLLALGALALFWGLDLGQYLRLSYLQQSQSEFAALYAQSPWQTRCVFFAIYLAVAALSLPGAFILTLAGGAVFGLGWGLLLISFASSMGATLSFWIARFLLRDAVQQRLGERLDQINHGLAREGVFYLLALRLMPVIPFILINLAMGLTRLPAWTFYWVSQIGMLAGTAAYVNAGTQLARIHALSDVLRPSLLGSLMLLGLLPLVARMGLNLLRTWRAQRQIYRPWLAQKPTHFDRNLVVIGAGAGGLVSAYIAATLKAKVTLVEAQKMGGDCLNTGCVPSKTLIKAARVAHQMRHASRYGLTDTQPVFRLAELMQRINASIASIAPHDSVERYTALGVEVLQGNAKLISPWTVQVSMNDGTTRTLTTRSIVIAAGASPVVPDLPGLQDVGFLTSDTLWDALARRDALPQRLLVLGAGPIGCELAQSFARLGCQVTLVDLAFQVLPHEDPQASALIEDAMRADGVRLLLGQQATRCELLGGKKTLWVQARNALKSDQANEEALVFDELICAVGRSARLTGYGLEALGIATANTLQTNDRLQTIFPNIYAAGDVAGPYQLTHVAAHQAWHATVNALLGGIKKFRVSYRVIPRVTFTDPELAHVGLSIQEADRQGVAYEITQLELGALDRAVTDSLTSGFVKVLTVPGRDRILGVTVVGEQAGELLAEYALALQNGWGLKKILSTVHAYPTFTEASRAVAGQWRRVHASERALRWAQRFHDWRRGD